MPVGPESSRQGKRGIRAALVAVGASLVALLCLAGGASAAKFTVDSVGDQADEAAGSGGCHTVLATCTLRAAIEESNASPGVKDSIQFGVAFDGHIGDTIELNATLPTITDPVRIGPFPLLQCETGYFGLPGPCVGIDGPSGGTAFRVEATNVWLAGFAISGTGTAIEAVGALGLEARNDWFGLELDGSERPIETGISLDQGSSGAIIGGAGSEPRDIFAHNSDVGVDIVGADATDIRGNGFGVMPDGATKAPNGTDIRISDAATGDERVARGNWIGGTPSAEQLASPICDGQCNVISGATGSGIDLSGQGPGEKPATGSTRIFGNYIGLDAFGESAVPNTQSGVLIGAAENTTVGGPWPGDRNLIAGGAQGISAGPVGGGPQIPGNLTVEGNWIGLDPSGTSTLAPPASRGIAVEDGYQVAISGNRISMAGGVAIEQGAQESVVRWNAIGEGVGGEDLSGGFVGIHLVNGCYLCSLVYENTISNASGNGLLIENDRNAVYGNRILDSGEAGLRIKDPGPFGIVGNRVGGDNPEEENTISGSGGAAIEIVLVTPFGLNTRNEVARNHGDLNSGPFIELLGGANGEIPPPVISSSTPSGASGTALPGATVRIFRKATSSPGELDGFLAEVSADEAGHWSAIYPAAISTGTNIAASQTSLIEGTATAEPADGTSELAFAAAAAGPEEAGKTRGNDDGSGPNFTPGPPARDSTPPETYIVKGPKRTTRSRIAEFRFGSSERGSRFGCRLDRRPVRRCSSPRGYRGLRVGKHLFTVWAIDPSGNRDASPARYAFRVQ